MHQIFPRSDERRTPADLDALYGVTRPTPEHRPWVALCMIASLDGSTVVDGRSGALGNAGDGAVFSALRRAADVVLVGAATAVAEQYRPARRSEQRIGVVTRSGRVNTSTDLFTSGSGFLVMPEDGPPIDAPIEVVRAGRGGVDLAAALEAIARWSSAPRLVQAEGGPTLNGALLDADLVDELNYTISPMLAGGSGPRMVVGGTDRHRRMRLAHVLSDDEGYLFTRWIRDDAR